ncbi:hypothetical protein SAMN04487996_109319 [Dyadobacter soli]|uniref:Uncharacterized protein n=1 Tax=Dyadobacter soli TaxID=659014 RepID=A0A1G7JKN4_9BACT|nr:hypothetical protein [Dyadobacter soli]SDF25415.1 hypothetical protein SAMN04487996_109319 [Dyadobacter soli]
MATLIIEGDNDQIATVKAFLNSVGINFRTEQDATEYLLSNSSNTTELLDSVKEALDGNTRTIGLDDIWK